MIGYERSYDPLKLKAKNGESFPYITYTTNLVKN